MIEIQPASLSGPAWIRNPNFAFIDADNIYQSASQLLDRRGIDSKEIDQFDFRKLFAGHDRCFIYNALDEKNEIPLWLKELQNTQGFIAKFGRLAKSGKRSKQQGVDVLLAIDAMQCSFRRSMTSCTLYTGDGDFLPLIDALVENGTFVKVKSFQNPNKGQVAPELRNRADAYEQINHRKMAAVLKRNQTTTIKSYQVKHLKTKSPEQIEICGTSFAYSEFEQGAFGDYRYMHKTEDGEFFAFKDMLWLQCWVELPE